MGCLQLKNHYFENPDFKITLRAPPFPQVSGLDQSGGMHGLISSVSQPEATKALADHFGDVVELLSSQLVSVELLDTSIGDNLAALGLMGSAAQNAWDSTVAPVMTASVVNPTTNHFNASPAVAGRPVSLDIVTGQLASSDVGSMSAIAANWTDTAGAVTEAVGQIPAAVGALASSAETPFVAKAIATLNQIGAPGDNTRRMLGRWRRIRRIW